MKTKTSHTKNLSGYSVSAFLILIIIALTSCEKDDIEEIVDKEALLTAHTWNFDKLSTTSTDPDDQYWVEVINANSKNATLNFSTDGIYTMTILEESLSGTWELNADGTKIIFNRGTFDETLQTIGTITSDVLELIVTEVAEDIGKVDIIFRWVQ